MSKYLWIKWYYIWSSLGFSSKRSSLEGGEINQTKAAVSQVTPAGCSRVLGTLIPPYSAVYFKFSMMTFLISDLKRINAEDIFKKKKKTSSSDRYTSIFYYEEYV